MIQLSTTLPAGIGADDQIHTFRLYSMRKDSRRTFARNIINAPCKPFPLNVLDCIFGDCRLFGCFYKSLIV